MKRSLASLLLAGFVTLTATGAFAARSVSKFTFTGFNANAAIAVEALCPDGSAVPAAVQQTSVFASDSMVRQSGTPSSSFRGVSVNIRFDSCADGSSLVGFFQLDGTGFAGDLNRVTIQKTFLADRSVRGSDEYGNMIWIPTGVQEVVELSVTLVANGDTFSGQTRNTSRSGSVTTKYTQNGTTNSADVVVSAKVAGVPVNYGNGFSYGEISQAKNGQMTIIADQ